MNKLSTEGRAQTLGVMVEGNSIRAIVRMTGASKNTIIKLLEDAGEAFSAYQDRAFRELDLIGSNSGNLGVLLRQAAQRHLLQGRARRRGRSLDLDCNRRANQAGAILAHWRPQRRDGNRICVRSRGPVSE